MASETRRCWMVGPWIVGRRMVLLGMAAASVAGAHSAQAGPDAAAPVIESERLGAPPDGFAVLDGIAALIDDAIVTRYEVERAAELNRAAEAAAGKPGPSSDEEWLQGAMDALVDETLILNEAKELELRVTDGDVDANLRRVKASSGFDDAQLEAAVQDMGFASLHAYREHTRREILKARTFMYKVGSRVNVGSIDVQRVLDEEYEGGTTSPEVKVRTLLRRVGPSDTEDDIAESYRMTQWLQSQADAAPELFGDLVRRYSEDDATRFDQGDLGWIRAGQFEDSALEEALFSTDVGGITPIVRARDGFRFFQIVERRRTAIRDLEGLRNSIYDRLVQAEQARIYAAWLQELRQTHYVELRL